MHVVGTPCPITKHPDHVRDRNTKEHGQTGLVASVVVGLLLVDDFEAVTHSCFPALGYASPDRAYHLTIPSSRFQ